MTLPSLLILACAIMRESSLKRPSSHSSACGLHRAFSGGRLGMVCAMVLLVATLCVACSIKQQRTSGDELAPVLQAMQEAVPQHVADPQRAQLLHQAIQGMDADLIEMRALLDRMHADMRSLNANPESTRAQFDQLLDRFDAQRKVIRDRVLQRHRDMIAATTEQEWQALSRYERAALSTVMR